MKDRNSIGSGEEKVRPEVTANLTVKKIENGCAECEVQLVAAGHEKMQYHAEPS